MARKEKKPSEEQEQIAIANYIAEKYPKVEFHSDFGSGTRLSMGQAKRQKLLNASRRGWPDIFIAEASGKYYGFFIELKRTGIKLKKKDGTYACEHYQEQAEQLKKLRKKGYKAEFSIGYEETIKKIDKYMKEGK